MLVWLTLPFYDFCGVRSVAVNSVYKLQFFNYIIDFSRWRPCTILDFFKIWNFNCWSVRMANMRHHAKICADLSNRCRDIVIFKLLGWRAPPSWISSDLKFVTDQTVTRAELRHRPKFRWNRWNCGRDMAIFRFFKMAVAAMLDFWNYKFLTVGRIVSVELRHCAKFCRNRSNHSVRFFMMSAAAILDFRNFNFSTVGTVKSVELHHRAKFSQNAVKPRPRYGDFSIFPRWRPSAI